jgi:hypothetical protein
MKRATQPIPKLHYDLPTAVTFLLAGLGLGSLLTMLFSPLPKYSSAALSSRLR